MKLKFAIVIACAGLLAACDPEASIGPQDTEAVRAQEAALLAAVTAEDAAAAAAFYTQDAQAFTPFEAPQTTPDAIRAGFQHIFDDPNGALRFNTADVIMPSSADYAVTEGDFTITFTDSATSQPATMTGHFVTLWRHQDDDSWKIVRDIATPGLQAPPPAAPATP